MEIFIKPKESYIIECHRFYLKENDVFIYVQTGKNGFIYRWMGTNFPDHTITEPIPPLTFLLLTGMSVDRVWGMGMRLTPGHMICKDDNENWNL